MGVTLWRFLRSTDGSMQSFSRSRFERFYKREEKLPDYAGNQAVIVSLAVEMENRKPVRVIRVWWARYKIDRDGVWDEQHESEALSDAMKLIDARRKDLFAESPPPIEALLGEIAIHASRVWEPSQQDLEGLCAAVNQRAKGVFLAHDGRRVFSV